MLPATLLRRTISGGLPQRRQALGVLVAVVGLAALTALLLPLRADLAVESVLLLYLLVVVTSSAIGGLWPAVAGAFAAVGLVNWYFTPPFHTLTIAANEHVLALVVFLVVAVLVAVYVTVAERNAAESARVRGEAASLDRANELRTALLNAVSHDLRSPLSSIKASVSSLRANDVEWSADQTTEFLETIENDADRLNHVVGNLLDMSRLQTGALELDRCPVALDEVVANALHSIGTAAHSVEVDVREDLPLVLVDRGLLERAVANIVENALRCSPPGSAVCIAARVVAPDVELAIIDHGPGVAPEDRERILRPFQRLHDSGEGGVGLGLAIAKGFIEANAGELVIDDTRGGGATFRILVAGAVS